MALPNDIGFVGFDDDDDCWLLTNDCCCCCDDIDAANATTDDAIADDEVGVGILFDLFRRCPVADVVDDDREVLKLSDEMTPSFCFLAARAASCSANDISLDLSL